MNTYYATLADWQHDTHQEGDYQIYATLAEAQACAREWILTNGIAILQILTINGVDLDANPDWCLWDHLQSDNIALFAEIGFSGH